MRRVTYSFSICDFEDVDWNIRFKIMNCKDIIVLFLLLNFVELQDRLLSLFMNCIFFLGRVGSFLLVGLFPSMVKLDSDIMVVSLLALTFYGIQKKLYNNPFLCIFLNNLAAGTLNSDVPRDLDLPLKDRFFIQPLTPAEAAQRAKESAKEILNVKELIDKKAWPYVQNDLRLKASYLRYDLNTVISAKPKDQKKPLKDLIGDLFKTIDDLDHAAKIKSTPEAEKYYAATVSKLNDVLSKIG
ncbi:oxygen-evolving enhancer protein 3-1, chloroplastic-like [Macadamia integrifolia]|uniref:oxygen-evolving enhancer protein 3-1, chloroplastic-like n=1 Tax=Macadamia integrifolia TaxID=60698 RepID=UPI001C5279E8|nr:oxygen-evolving enhancer protein 3-1, chloroplastic-like [Macadamia integrifolia]